MLLDFTTNLLIFLASLDIKGIGSIGSMFAIVAAMTSTLQPNRRLKSTDISSVAQRVLLVEGDTCSQLNSEEKHQILLSSHIPTASSPNTPGATSAFIEQPQTMPTSQPTRPSYDSGLHCAKGREALKFRAEGDTSMFFRNPTSATIESKSAKSSTHDLVVPTAPTGNRPVSVVSGRGAVLAFEGTI